MATETEPDEALQVGSTGEASIAVAPFEKTYSGGLVGGRRQVMVANDLGTFPLRCLNYYTPLFAWGFHGAGPDELAIAILHNYFDLRQTLFDRRVLDLHSAFSDEVISKLTSDRQWSLPAGLVGKWVRQREGRAVATVGERTAP